MQELPFSIPITGIIRMEDNLVTIIVSRAETSISLETGVAPGKRVPLGKGRSMFDVILDAAREVIAQKGFNRFSAADLYAAARSKYPGLKRGSFMARVIASTPDHPSHKHHKSRRDYLSRIGPGIYWLNEQYTGKMQPTENPVQ